MNYWRNSKSHQLGSEDPRPIIFRPTACIRFNCTNQCRYTVATTNNGDMQG